METRFCPNCGAAIQPDDAFCRACGRELAALQRPLRYRLSPARVVFMSILSAGLYLFYWFYLTWRQYRDHTGKEAYPVWHALTLLVPIYSFFRMHAHVRCFKELMLGAGVTTALSAGTAVLAVVVLSILGGVAFRLGFGEITQGVATALFLIYLAEVGITVGLLMQIQENLNVYWDGLSDSPSQDARIGLGEIVFAIIGVLIGLDSFLILVSESYRAGV